ncbi:hypothetical protein CC2G_010091 [Coprinopsis cinerea AmutBmut pab1-1]|nr:hypothetical protein CC2G_010091 [Coprinopsis cinerea AmutBmut pab1-1]
MSQVPLPNYSLDGPHHNYYFLPQVTNYEDNDADGDYELEDPDQDPHNEPEQRKDSIFNRKKQLGHSVKRTYRVKDLHELIHQGGIDLNPEYQRDVVWSESKQTALLDSIAHRYHVPPILFVVHEEDGEETRVCVDGKQRLTSIQRFLDGQIPIKCGDGKNRWWTFPKNAKGKLAVSDEDKEEFGNIEISVEEYRGITELSERDMFGRVQMGMTLTSAERWHAISSPRSKWINHLQDTHVLVDNGLAANLTMTLSRGRDFSNMVHLVYFCDQVEERGAYSSQKAEAWLRSTETPSQEFKRDIDKVLRELNQLATDEEYSDLLNKVDKVLAPIELSFIGVLLYLLGDDADLKTKAQAINTFRHTVHKKYPSHLRTNSSIAKSLWGLIDDLVDNPLTKYLDPDDFACRGKKRKKRAIDDDPNDGTYRSKVPRTKKTVSVASK